MDSGILCDVVNRRDGVVAARVFAPWTGMEAVMRSEGIPLWGIEARHAVRDFRPDRLLAEL